MTHPKANARLTEAQAAVLLWFSVREYWQCQPYRMFSNLTLTSLVKRKFLKKRWLRRPVEYLITDEGRIASGLRALETGYAIEQEEKS